MNKETYRCTICGYIITDVEPPESCPVCGAPKEDFEVVQQRNQDQSGEVVYRCQNCEYLHHGEQPPDQCPVCGLSREHFELMHMHQQAIMETDVQHVVILGGGIAGLSAASVIRETAANIRITMISNEQKLPYYRLNLTRLMGNEIEESALCINPQYWYDEQRIEVLKNRVVTNIDRGSQKVEFFDGDQMAYDRLIIALGAHPFIPPITGVSHPKVLSIRSIEDVHHLKKTFKVGDTCLVIGGGVLGLESAAAIASTGIIVTVVEGSGWLMPRQLNQVASTYVEKSLTEIGITVAYDFRTGEIKAYKKGLEVIALDGRVIYTDHIIMATGVKPNTYLARKAQLEVNRGLIVDDYMVTSDPHIYGAGDVSEHYGVAYGLWNVAMYQGRIAGLNAIGHQLAFGGMPRSNTLKVLNQDVFSVGEIMPLDGGYFVLEKAQDEQYMMIMVYDAKLVGAIAIGYPTLSNKLKKAVEDGMYIAPDTTEIDRVIESLS